MILLIPYEVDIPFARTPVVNWLLIVVMITIFAFQANFQYKNRTDYSYQNRNYYSDTENPADTADPNIPAQDADPNMPAEDSDYNTDDTEDFESEYRRENDAKLKRQFGPFRPYVLDGFDIKGLFGHMFLHGGILHLIGNMIFLWVFGNAVCQKLGHVMYLPAFILCGLAGGLLHLIISDSPAVGASGAIYGIIGMYLILYPVHDINVFWFILMILVPRAGTFAISGFWIILLWLAFDVYGATHGGGMVAYGAHLGGFIAGAALATLLLVTKVIVMDHDEESLLQIIGEKFNLGSRDAGGWTDVKEVEKQQTITDGNTFHDEQTETRRPREISIASETETIPPQRRLTDDQRRQQAKRMYEEGFIRFYCPCGQKIKMPIHYIGRKGKCPKCKKNIIIPKP